MTLILFLILILFVVYSNSSRCPANLSVSISSRFQSASHLLNPVDASFRFVHCQLLDVRTLSNRLHAHHVLAALEAKEPAPRCLPTRVFEEVVFFSPAGVQLVSPRVLQRPVLHSGRGIFAPPDQEHGVVHALPVLFCQRVEHLVHAVVLRVDALRVVHERVIRFEPQHQRAVVEELLLDIFFVTEKIPPPDVPHVVRPVHKLLRRTRLRDSLARARAAVPAAGRGALGGVRREPVHPAPLPDEVRVAAVAALVGLAAAQRVGKRELGGLRERSGDLLVGGVFPLQFAQFLDAEPRVQGEVGGDDVARPAVPLVYALGDHQRVPPGSLVAPVETRGKRRRTSRRFRFLLEESHRVGAGVRSGSACSRAFEPLAAVVVGARKSGLPPAHQVELPRSLVQEPLVDFGLPPEVERVDFVGDLLVLPEAADAIGLLQKGSLRDQVRQRCRWQFLLRARLRLLLRCRTPCRGRIRIATRGRPSAQRSTQQVPRVLRFRPPVRCTCSCSPDIILSAPVRLRLPVRY
mmetsp:Transcript_25168/g.63325  ORF Transcript_25168/g.63325 Transcript_25168/m.63325 type:complete len:520 (+) Transcript_25168:461-2020(+)